MSCCFFGASTKDRKNTASSRHKMDVNFPGVVKNFPYEELKSGTNNFNTTNKIGRGGFGTVYKGTLKNGVQVAVKVLSAESKQGVREFLAEINTISTVQHHNLVQLIGYCIHGTSRVLIYEYLENISLDRVLLGYNRTNIMLDWRRRSGICIGTAKGLAYLHEEIVPHIVHRDVKASNILLADDFTPKIGDFGLAKIFPENITHITTRIAGTTGYLAPEYALGGQLTMKADVYSFGVLVLEVVSGRSSSKANCGGTQKLLLGWAWQLYEENKLLELVDPVLGEYPEEEVVRYIKVALFCTQGMANKRPAMSQVLEMLSRNIQLNEKQLTPPGFFQTSGESSGRALDKKSPTKSTSDEMSSVPVTITQVTAR